MIEQYLPRKRGKYRNIIYVNFELLVRFQFEIFYFHSLVHTSLLQRVNTENKTVNFEYHITITIYYELEKNIKFSSQYIHKQANRGTTNNDFIRILP